MATTRQSTTVLTSETVSTTQPNLGSVAPTNGQDTSCGSSCLGTYCSGSYYTGSTCVDGRCRCLNNPNRDQCTCLAIVGNCHVTQGASVRVGTPTYARKSQTTYSCVANDNCNYDVHVIANYESNGHSGFRIHNTGNTNVNLAVTGTSSKPLILVFVSYEPVNWTLTIPTGVVIDRIILSSYYIDRSSVLYTPGQVLTLERSTYQNLPCAYGSDTGGCHTLQVLHYLHRRFGPVSSFSGSYSADSWSLDITRQSTSGCTSPTTASETSTEATTRSVAPTNGQSGSCSTCVGGRCRCLNNPNRDQCSCWAIVGSCHITQGASVRVGTPTYTGKSQTTYSCVANDNCNYDVHVIGNYESNGHSGFRIHNTGNTNVNLTVTGTSSKPLILVFLSYEPVNWTLTIPTGVVIDRIILSSYYIDRSSVLYTPGQVLTLERSTYQNLPYAYGSDSGGGHTLEVLQYLHGRFGPVSSFSGSYSADSWSLDIKRHNISGCTSPTTASETFTEATTRQSTTVLTSEAVSTTQSSLDLPLQISFVNNSPRIVGNNVSVDVNVSKAIQSLTCHLRGVSGVSQEFSNEQDCSSLNIIYPNLNAGKYALRVVGKAVTGERAKIRRVFLIGSSSGDCTVNLINRGIVVRGDMVSVWFAVNGDASSHTCRIDRQPKKTCESPVTYSGLSSGEHSFQVSPQGCAAGSSYKLRATITVA